MRFRSRRGFSLAEALIVIMMVSVLGGLATAIYFAALRAYAQSYASYSAQQEADILLTQLYRQIWSAMQVLEAEDDALTVVLPQQQGDTLVIPLVAGDVIRFYRGDEAGEEDPDGAFLWMENLSRGERQVITSHLQDLVFSYEPSAEQVQRITVTLTTVDTQSHRTRVFTTSLSITPRNLNLWP
jgi:type II secretory pathway component PulJ